MMIGQTGFEDEKRRRLKLWLMEAALAIPAFAFLALGLVACMVVAETGVTLRGVSLVLGLFSAGSLCIYGIWRVDREAGEISRELTERTGEVSKIWYLAPLTGLIGGIAAYYKLRETDEKLAWKLLLLGVLVTIVLILMRTSRFFG
jgi:uncharacterized membrane protein